MSFISLRNVSYTYPNGFNAVEEIDMSFEKGEAVAIIGQNGAGKTTAVKLMNGLLKPTEGEVIIDNWNTKDYTTAQISRKVGYVFQNPDEEIFHTTVYGEIEFGPKNLGLNFEEIKERVTKAAELLKITEYLKEHPYNLPFSIRKFVTIASVIAMNPDVYIFDEPTAGQDVKALKQLGNLIKTLRDSGKTVIIITHDMEFVIQNFDRVIVLANKSKIADAQKSQVFWNYEILKKSMLKQPCASQLSNALNIKGERILSINDMVQYLETNSLEKASM